MFVCLFLSRMIFLRCWSGIGNGRWPGVGCSLGTEEDLWIFLNNSSFWRPEWPWPCVFENPWGPNSEGTAGAERWVPPCSIIPCRGRDSPQSPLPPVLGSVHVVTSMLSLVAAQADSDRGKDHCRAVLPVTNGSVLSKFREAWRKNWPLNYRWRHPDSRLSQVECPRPTLY